MDVIMDIASRYGLYVVEDAAQGVNAKYNGKFLGTIGDIGTYSFHETKNFICGEGGAIIGNDEQLMDQCYTVHNHGTSRRGVNEVIGPKYRMNEFEAAVLLGQLAGVEERFLRRIENAAYLTSTMNVFPGVRPL